MKESISHKELCGYLSLLRSRIDTVFPAPNVVFLNSHALYLYLEGQRCGKATIGEILQKIEPCIPLAITEESFSLFLSACTQAKAERMRQFLESSKADFLLLLHQTAAHEEQWQALNALCETLRQKNAYQS